jgi:hypothetical protein
MRILESFSELEKLIPSMVNVSETSSAAVI